ncbi:beta-N-acetylhexosaminidase [Methylovirgula sp. 4M-Z18]|nr:beta-N-acetylhexosaminidase [Methylovirgula sp. 4M-Z18]
MTAQAPFALELEWTVAAGDQPCIYRFTLHNRGTEPLANFSLAWSGPGRIDPKSAIENAVLLRRVSNFTEVMPPQGFVLEPNTSWTFTIRGTSYPLRHWTDAARSAYVTNAAGKHVSVDVGICRSTGATDDTPKLDIEAIGDLSDLSDGIAVVPRPGTVHVNGARNAASSLSLRAKSPVALKAATHFETLVTQLFPDESLIGDGIDINFAHRDGAQESYTIAFGDQVTLSASSESGYLYGLVTLGQILRAARQAPEHCRFPTEGYIHDTPHHTWRGAHLDVARQYYTMDELRRFTAILAWNKLNRFHLHLTEDEAWRYEVEAYPDLARVGAFRGAGLALPPLLGSGAASYGGFYAKADLRALVALAENYNIVVVPEVDVPGHSYAAIMALPFLRDPGENAEYQSIQGFPNNCLNAGVPKTLQFVETIFAELMEIFPGPWIHVGADEVPEDAWHASPLARQHLPNAGETIAQPLQADFLRHLHRQIQAAGRTTGAWEEGAHGGGVTPEKSYLVAWRSTAVGAELAAQGYDVVMSPGQAYYLDMALSPDWWEPGASWAGTSSLENTYRFDPYHGFAPEHRARMIGVQACIWSEPMSDRRVFQRLVFPRLSAIAETGWTPPSAKSWKHFAASSRFMPSLYGDLCA